MARKFEYAEGRHAWFMEKCEERWLIALYHEVAPNIPNNLGWKLAFESNFFSDGAGVGAHHVAEINNQRTRLSLRSLAFRETHVYDYARNSDRAYKAQMRRDWRDEYVDLDPAAQQAWIKDCEMGIANLEPPHRTFEEYQRDSRERRDRDEQKSVSRERERRMQAVIEARIEEPQAVAAQQHQQRSLPHLRSLPDTTLRQLRLAARLPDATALLGDIIGGISPDAALDLAETMDDDPIVQMALLRRSMI